MKIAFLLGGSLLIAFGGRATSAAPMKLWEELSNELKQMKQELKAEQERMEADGRKMREEAEVEAEAERKRMRAELDDIKQKCASMGANATTQNGKTVGLIIQEVNGFLHFYEQTVNPTTNKIEERHYSLNRNDPNAEPTCGQPTR